MKRKLLQEENLVEYIKQNKARTCRTNVPGKLTVEGKLLYADRKYMASADQGRDGQNSSNSNGTEFLTQSVLWKKKSPEKKKMSLQVLAKIERVVSYRLT
jgi:hypothetical protein